MNSLKVRLLSHFPPARIYSYVSLLFIHILRLLEYIEEALGYRRAWTTGHTNERARRQRDTPGRDD